MLLLFHLCTMWRAAVAANLVLACHCLAAIVGRSQETASSECPQGLEQCRTTRRCIQPAWFCDGENDCGDNSDESECANHQCTDDQVRCKSGQCVPKHYFCLSLAECADGSLKPQDVCTASCPFGQISCPATKKCIREVWMCDGDDDCDDGWDEKSEICRDRACPASKIKCKSGRCIDREPFCKGLLSCNDGTAAEDVCPALTCDEGWSKCAKVNKCIREAWFCDGDSDCPDNSDEDAAFCAVRQCAAKMLRCTSGQCVDETEFCRQTARCKDGSIRLEDVTCPAVSEPSLTASQDNPVEAFPITLCMANIQMKCIAPLAAESATVDMFMQQILTSHLRETCSALQVVKECIANALNTDCSAADVQSMPTTLRQLMLIYLRSIEYICGQHIDVFEQHKSCLVGSDLMYAVDKSCDVGEKLQLDICASQPDLECAIGVVSNKCGPEIAGHLIALAADILKDLGCSSTRSRKYHRS